MRLQELMKGQKSPTCSVTAILLIIDVISIIVVVFFVVFLLGGAVAFQGSFKGSLGNLGCRV